MPKIIGASLREHREQTRLRLFAALSELIGERGFDAVTLSEVATRAGVGRTAVYNHFPDKEAMLVGLIMHETTGWAEALNQALAGIDDPVEQLRTYVREQLTLKAEFHFAPGPDLRRVLSAPTQARVREHVVLVEQILRRILARGIATGAFPEQELDVTLPLVIACLSGRGVPAGGPAREHAIAQTEAFVLRAVGAPELVLV
ncbi:TetR/AcrR family transcriptional regulator [Cellulomonas citrea]|uniref:TetR/AcrR family transcriptional regulator n=1 Tax=Cellulomonas citrea TaxID=1909423 RepID=UPI00135B1C88|nr:TetR/AcrR family transcriptional regulator [Cellulomonas citrea]